MLIVFLGLFSIKGITQLTTNSELLERAGHGLRLAENSNYAKAMSLAKEKGWQISIKNKEGRVGQLVGVDLLGFPKYYISQNNTIAAATTTVIHYFSDITTILRRQRLHTTTTAATETTTA